MQLLLLNNNRFFYL